jgi:hypothetical protein
LPLGRCSRFALLPALLVWGWGACTDSNPAFTHGMSDAADTSVGEGGRGVSPSGSGGRGEASRDASPSDALVPSGDGPPNPADLPAPDQPDLVTGLVGYWRMDEPSNATTARDSSGLGHHGTLEMLDPAKVWVAGRFGTALSIPGGTASDNAGVRVELTDRIKNLTRYTVAAWARRTRLRPVAYQSLISRQLGTGIAEVFDMSVSKDLLVIYASDRDASGVSGATSPDPAPVNTWFHAAGTFDGTTLRIYENGVEKKATAFSQPLPDSAAPLYLGTNKNGSGASTAHHTWEGQLDEVMLYDRALPGDAIAALASGTRPEVP